MLNRAFIKNPVKQKFKIRSGYLEIENFRQILGRLKFEPSAWAQWNLELGKPSLPMSLSQSKLSRLAHKLHYKVRLIILELNCFFISLAHNKGGKVVRLSVVLCLEAHPKA